MKSYILSLCLLLVVVHGTVHNTDRAWHKWKTLHGKSYETEGEERHRRGIWEDNRNYVELHGNRAEVTFSVELNHLSDQSSSDRNRAEVLQEAKEEQIYKNSFEQQPPPPFSVDWRTKGVISAVRNQSNMGSSVAIAATECVESLHAIQNKNNLELLSSHEVADCCPTKIYSDGIFKCIQNIGGICEITTYPTATGICRNSTCSPAAKIDGGKTVPKGEETSLMYIVVLQPVMAAIDASHQSFLMYKSGVYNEPQCSQTQLDHAVQIVGYGGTSDKYYWIIKNSWGASWGMNGYALIERYKNMCGIATAAFYPIQA